jgi:hypothetical protein
VNIPDFNRQVIALSSTLLSDSDSKRNEELAREGVMGADSFVTRVFIPGAVLKYDCNILRQIPVKETGGFSDPKGRRTRAVFVVAKSNDRTDERRGCKAGALAYRYLLASRLTWSTE